MSKAYLACLLAVFAFVNAYPSDRNSSTLTPNLKSTSSNSQIVNSYKRFTKHLKTTASVGYQSNAYHVKDINYRSQANMGLEFAYDLGNKSQTILTTSASLDFADTERREEAEYNRGDLGDMGISYRREFPSLFNDWMTPMAGGTLLLPTSESSRSIDELYMATAVSGGVKLELKKVGWEQISPSYRVRFIRNFHKHYNNVYGDPLMAYKMEHCFGFLWGFLDGSLVLTYFFGIGQSWTYEVRHNPTYKHHWGIDYSINKQWRISALLSEGQDVYKANGVDWNMKVFDRENIKAVAALNLAYTF